jgi:nucleoside-diphosphate-sugar epimerase
VVHKETVLVTGANGFIGGWLAETLCLTGAAHVRAGIRNWGSAARLGRFPMEIVLCDIMDKAQIAQAIAGGTCVIHCAKGSEESITQGTRNMLEAALRQKVRRFIHLSTAEVYGNPGGEIDEMFPYQYTGSPYGDSKIEAEKLCWDYYGKGLPVAVIRPSIVYGPFSKTWTVEIALKLRSGNWGIFKDHGDGVCNLIYIADLVSAIMLAARDESAIGQAFNLNGPETPTWNEYFQRFNAALGLPELKVTEPARANLRALVMEPVRSSAKLAQRHFERPIRRIAARSKLAKQVLKYVEKTMKTSPRLTDFSLYSRKAFYSAAKAQQMLNYEPKFGLDKGSANSYIIIRWSSRLFS